MRTIKKYDVFFEAYSVMFFIEAYSVFVFVFLFVFLFVFFF